MGKKRQLYNCHIRAFTLLESVIALFVVSMTSLLFVSSLSSMKSALSYHAKHGELDVYRFFAYIENHLTSEQIQTIGNNTIVTADEDKKVYYEMYQNLIRRRGEKGGHEPLLGGVTRWEIERKENTIVIWIWMETGEVYEKHLFITTQQKE